MLEDYYKMEIFSLNKFFNQLIHLLMYSYPSKEIFFKWETYKLILQIKRDNYTYQILLSNLLILPLYQTQDYISNSEYTLMFKKIKIFSYL